MCNLQVGDIVGCQAENPGAYNINRERIASSYQDIERLYQPVFQRRGRIVSVYCAFDTVYYRDVGFYVLIDIDNL